MTELYLWQQLLAVKEEGTMSAAAERLHLTQPALSRSMKKLEESLGVSLFVRSKNSIALNDTGLLAAECAKKLLELEAGSEEKLRRFAAQRAGVRFAVCAPTALRDVNDALLRREPGIKAEGTVEPEEALLPGLENGLYDFIICRGAPQSEGLYSVFYRTETLLLLVPPGHRLYSCEEVVPGDLAGENIFLYKNIGFWEKVHREHMPEAHFMVMEDRGAFLAVSEKSRFLSFTTDVQPTPGDGRRVLPIRCEDMSASYYCVCRSEESSRFRPLFAAMKKDAGKIERGSLT